MENFYGIAWTNGPNSWDPLDFDLGNNIHFGRMLYSPPFEVTTNGDISSYILRSFSLDENCKILEMLLDTGKKYKDGTSITTMDLIFPILRMALARPEFPVIEAIDGIDEWRKQQVPLSILQKGITVNGNLVTVRFRSPQPQALFRLSFELFSIVPSKCFDLKTSTLICDHPPESGRYYLEEKISLRSPPTQINFTRASDTEKTPKKITISYIDKNDIDEFLNKHPGSIVHTSDLDHSKIELEILARKHSIFETPKSWFGVFVLSKFSPIFQNQTDRLIFRNKFLKNLFQSEDLSFDVETSIFTEIMPGFLSKSIEEFEQRELSNTHKTLRYFSRGISNENLIRVLEKTCLELKIKCERVQSEEYNSNAFNNGSIDLLFGKTGFWPKDPLGDLKMLFTPNLHQDLKGIWSEKNILNQIDELNKYDQKNNSEALKTLNLNIQSTGLFNIFAHFKYYYLTNEDRAKKLRWIPQTVTEPYPWNIFND